MENWKTYSLAMLALIGTGFLVYTGLLDAEVWKWAVGIALGSYTARTVADKITKTKSEGK